MAWQKVKISKPKRGRPLGSKNKPKNKGGGRVIKRTLNALDKAHLDELADLRVLSDRQDAAIAQATDEITDLRAQVEFYRKQVNHFLALLNILARGQ